MFSSPLIHRVAQVSLWMAAIIVLGTAGYSMIEGWSTLDGFYMSVITVATVGYGETQELSSIGRLFTCLLIFISIICLSCWTACLTSLFVEGDLTGAFSFRRARKMAKAMQDHTIICGSGTMAQATLDILLRKRQAVVVIDSDKQTLASVRRRYPNIAIIEDNAVNELALSSANVLEARCVIAATESDFDNLMIAMTCKDLGTELHVIARSDDRHVASRMMKLGVEKVISPFQISGEQAASFAIDVPAN